MLFYEQNECVSQHNIEEQAHQCQQVKISSLRTGMGAYAQERHKLSFVHGSDKYLTYEVIFASHYVRVKHLGKIQASAKKFRSVSNPLDLV